jgi:hypothetical protein
MLVQNDPEACGYKLVSGIRKKVQLEDVPFETLDDASIERLNAPEVGIQLAEDPFFKMEHDQKDKIVAKKRSVGLTALIERQEKLSDQYGSNAALRKKFRDEKKVLKRKADEATRLNMSIPLLDIHKDDVIASKSVLFHNLSKRSQKKAKLTPQYDRFANFGSSNTKPTPRMSTIVRRRK